MPVWAFISPGYPLYKAYIPYIQSRRGDSSTYITYRNQLIIAVLGVTGGLSISTVLTGVFLFASTTAASSNSTFTTHLLYAVLYAYTVEIFPARDGGTGNALTALSHRVLGEWHDGAGLCSRCLVHLPSAAGVIVSILPDESRRGKAGL